MGIIGDTVTVDPRIGIDTNVPVAALRSRRGASFALLQWREEGGFRPVVTVPLVMEYEDVLLRAGTVPVPASAVQDVIDLIVASAHQQTVHFLWRPRLADPKDDTVLEAAANGGAESIVTHKLRDFAPARTRGLCVETPRAFLARMNQEKQRWPR
jgi:predicted nucleic acid-binding protein